MPFTCEAARFEDGPALANAYISAFYGDPFHDTLIQDVPFDRQVAGVIKRFPHNFVRPTVHYRKVVDTDTGAVVSYAKWGLDNTDDIIMLPQNCAYANSRLLDVPDEFKHTIEAPYSDPEGINDPFAEWFTEQARSARKEALGDRPMLRESRPFLTSRALLTLCPDLMMLGTVPSAQGQGAGSLQVKWGVEFADKHGLPCWTEASPHSVRILQRLGFKPKREIICQIDEKCGGGTYVYTCMLREPQRSD
ncbi:Uncharacterized protein TPAR_04246 [Tolypocladium paradoxum]|uniref:N-acetyltransferase domain-containing protein n=1 Tax=Tolypocladium paradoxum TaxID=94208 RepID=A0A2S4KZF4_9HYPO|nr:Uncharacterized protein TPAR_04246 [Tolypocladium paradoxum]